MNPADLPTARELFSQWQRARGGRVEPASRPFSRHWEDLLEDARLISATERGEAERDARVMETDGWIELKPVRYRPHLIDRVVIPLAAEARWCEAFGFVPPSDEEARQIREFPWEPELSFLRDAKLSLSFAELCQVNEFMKDRSRERPIVPIKERSLQIFGDEKRLDVLYSSSALFAEGRLALDQLGCAIVPEPLGWSRGAAPEGPFIVLENAATWHSYCRWNELSRCFSAVIYGGGNRFADSVGFLQEIQKEIGGVRPVLYFGDLDFAGLAIPQRASRRSVELGMPAVEPHLPSYRWLLSLAESKAMAVCVDVPADRELCRWLGSLGDAAWAVLSGGNRLAQEHIGWQFLQSQLSVVSPASRPG